MSCPHGVPKPQCLFQEVDVCCSSQHWRCRLHTSPRNLQTVANKSCWLCICMWYCPCYPIIDLTYTTSTMHTVSFNLGVVVGTPFSWAATACTLSLVTHTDAVRCILREQCAKPLIGRWWVERDGGRPPEFQKLLLRTISQHCWLPPWLLLHTCIIMVYSA